MGNQPSKAPPSTASAGGPPQTSSTHPSSSSASTSSPSPSKRDPRSIVAPGAAVPPEASLAHATAIRGSTSTSNPQSRLAPILPSVAAAASGVGTYTPAASRSGSSAGSGSKVLPTSTASTGGDDGATSQQQKQQQTRHMTTPQQVYRNMPPHHDDDVPPHHDPPPPHHDDAGSSSNSSDTKKTLPPHHELPPHHDAGGDKQSGKSDGPASTGSHRTDPAISTAPSGDDDRTTAAAAQLQQYVDSTQDLSYLTRPPRLPLPIKKEGLAASGSPVVAPAAVGDPLEEGMYLDGGGATSDGDLPVLASTFDPTTSSPDWVTSNAQDNHHDHQHYDDGNYDHDFDGDEKPSMIPTTIWWKRGGERVYVTGTMFSWSTKMRMQPVDNQPGVFSVLLKVRPGTHQVRFVVDGKMTTSADLPTTVDFGNNLVNYIVVAAGPEEMAMRPTSAIGPASSSLPTTTETVRRKKEGAGRRRRRQVPPIEEYTNNIHRFLLDLDQPEDSVDYRDASIAIQRIATPPTIPGNLTKPILNVQSMVKDDNSVLTLPNHTVLNHLATSSIKHGTLAIAATTRYRKKYVTTIIYKAASD